MASDNGITVDLGGDGIDPRAVAHSLKSADAAVLATADEWGCIRLYTRDGNLLKCDAHFAFKITEPENPPDPEPDLFNQV